MEFHEKSWPDKPRKKNKQAKEKKLIMKIVWINCHAPPKNILPFSFIRSHFFLHRSVINNPRTDFIQRFGDLRSVVFTCDCERETRKKSPIIHLLIVIFFYCPTSWKWKLHFYGRFEDFLVKFRDNSWSGSTSCQVISDFVLPSTAFCFATLRGCEVGQ